MSDFKEFVSNPGDRYRTVFEPCIDDDGLITLKPIDKVDYYEKIQADKQLCDINYLLQRYAAGDTSVFDQRETYFADVTKAPKSLAEAYEIMFKAEHYFEQLPVAVKEKFDNNYYRFLQSAGTDEWLQKMQIDVPGPVEKESETKE